MHPSDFCVSVPIWQEPLVHRLNSEGIIFPEGPPSLALLLSMVVPPSSVDGSTILAMELEVEKPFWQVLSATSQLHPLVTKFVVPVEFSGSILTSPDFTHRIVRGLCITGEQNVNNVALKAFLTNRLDLETLRLTIADNEIVTAIGTCKNLRQLTVSVLHHPPIDVIDYISKCCINLTTVKIEGSWLSRVQREELTRQATNVLIRARQSPQVNNSVVFDPSIMDFHLITILGEMPSGIRVFTLRNCKNLTDLSLSHLSHRRMVGIDLIGAEKISFEAIKKLIWCRTELKDLKMRLNSNTDNIVQAIGTCSGLRCLSLEIDLPDAYPCLINILKNCRNLTTLNLKGSKSSFTDVQIEALLRINPGLNILLP